PKSNREEEKKNEQTNDTGGNRTRPAKLRQGCSTLGQGCLSFAPPTGVRCVHADSSRPRRMSSWRVPRSTSPSRANRGSPKIKAPFLTPATINILYIAIVACAIFVIDTQVHVDIDVPVLYVAVVLMSTRLFEGRGILIVSLGCAVLVVAGYLLSPGNLL